MHVMLVTRLRSATEINRNVTTVLTAYVAEDAKSNHCLLVKDEGIRGKVCCKVIQ